MDSPEDLQKALRILRRRLDRSEAHRAKLEADLDRVKAFHGAVIERLEASETEARRANQAKSRFLANMSHEIRTPLSGVVGVADLLLRAGLDDQQLDLARTLKDASDLLLALLDDILDFSKIEAGELALIDATFDPLEVLRGVPALYRNRADAKGVALTVRDEGLPTAVRGDASRVRQILGNLVANAIKFTDEGQVTVTGRTTRGGICFVVEDTGIGIPDALHDAVFDPFRQQDDSSTRKVGGTGLGLAISRDLARAMGGDLQLRSRVGQGTSITVVLPLIATEDTAELFDVDITLQLDGARVLLAEDSPVNRLVAEKLLDQLGCVVTSVTNGLEAVEAFDETFDLVLLDCQMPVMDGIEAARRIRATSDVPIIAVTASVISDNRDRCIEAGMDAFLAKPFTLAGLADVIARVS